VQNLSPAFIALVEGVWSDFQLQKGNKRANRIIFLPSFFTANKLKQKVEQTKKNFLMKKGEKKTINFLPR
jgi:hypothetical protein